jgi:alkylation response protein AidB-like acyl-CoA dehydrogenase
MNFQPFTEEHEMLAQSVRDFLHKEVLPFAYQWEKDQHCPREVFQRMGELGFFGVTYPVEVGGSGMDFWAAVTVARELSMANVGGLALSLFAHAYLPPPMLNAIGTPEQKERWLIPALKGEKIGSLAISEAGAGSDVGGIRTTAEDKGDHYVINGSKCWITNGNLADFLVLAARTGEGHNLTLFCFDTKTPGFSSTKIKDKLGMHSSDTSELFFDNCIVPKSDVIGQPGMGFYYIMNNFQEERLIGAVSGVFAAEYAYNRAVEYSRQREAFGRKIGKFQAIRHKLASMATRVEACRSLAYRAVYEFIETGPAAVGTISMAKAFIGEEIQSIIYDSIQVLGGVGYTEEYGVARTYRDMRLFSIGGGTTEIMYEIIARLVVDQNQYARQLMKSRDQETVH